MITYNGLDLFSSGNSRLIPGPVESRDVVADSPGTVGASRIGQGRRPRTIEQQGTLVGDTASGLQGLIDAIDAQVGSDAALLRDAQGEEWPHCVLRAFQPSRFFRLGPRHAADYTLTYLQVQP